MNVTKKIVVTNCLECPLVTSCKVWKKLTPKQKFSIKTAVNVKCGILQGCPLEDNLTPQDIHVIQSDSFQAGLNEAANNLHKFQK